MIDNYIETYIFNKNLDYRFNFSNHLAREEGPSRIRNKFKIRVDKVRQFYRQMQEIPEVVSVEKLYTGGYHCILNVFCQNTEQLDAVQTKLIDLGYEEQTTLLCSPQKEKQTGLDLRIDDGQ